MKESEKLKKTAEETSTAYNKLLIEAERTRRTAKKTIEDSVKAQTRQICEEAYRKNYNMFEEKLGRIKKFAVASISILGIYDMCVTGAWISDHTSVFAGQTGIVSFFVSLWNMLVFIWTSGNNILNMAVNALRSSTSDLIAELIVYGLFAVLCLVGLFTGIYKGIPKIKKNLRKIMQTYNRNGIVGYKKAMTVSLCVIALCFAILLAEYAMVNVIGVWLLMSLGFNLTYHFVTYDK